MKHIGAIKEKIKKWTYTPDTINYPEDTSDIHVNIFCSSPQGSTNKILRKLTLLQNMHVLCECKELIKNIY